MFYADPELDRLDHLRADPDAIETLWQDPLTRVIPIWNNRSLVERQGAKDIRAASLTVAELPVGYQRKTMLGKRADTPWFAVQLASPEPDLTALLKNSTFDPAKSAFEDLRVVGPFLPAEEGALLVYARALNIWQSGSEYCSRCGNPALLSNGGHMRLCNNAECKAQVFPRTDPAVIMLVIDGNDRSRCLMGRNSAWPSGVFSTLAGFVEAGESLESAVAREVQEETGVVVSQVEYVASQPWPFPRSIMLGFKAVAHETEITVNYDELEDARWFHKDDVRTFGDWAEESDRFKLPRPDSIARHLIDSWLEDT